MGEGMVDIACTNYDPLDTSRQRSIVLESLAMLGTVRAGVRSARSHPRAGRTSRTAAAPTTSAAPLRLGLLPPHPRTLTGKAHLGRRSSAAHASSSQVASRGGRPFHSACTRRAGADLNGRGMGAAAGGNNGKDGDSSSSSDSSDSSDDDAEGQKVTEARRNENTERRAEGGSSASGGPRKAGAQEEDDSGGHDYRSVGSEIYEDGDLEAGETMQGMYDFVDDIVETQHVPTIQDPFDHRGRFHRCPGKKQGKAALPSTCQIFDIKELHVNHTPLLQRFVNDAGMILGRYRTGLCAKCQRKVARTIKASRQMGLVPTISTYEVRDTGPGGIFAWAGKDGDHDAMAKAKAAAERARQKNGENKRFGSLA